MPNNSPIALILGAGSNIGQHVGKAFAAKGYKIVLAARSLKEEDSTPDQPNIQSDFTDPGSIIQTFAKVKAKFGLPSVVVYSATTTSDPANPLGLDLKAFTPPLLGLGVGKSATAHIIHSAANAYKDKGFKFYYADERNADGLPACGEIDGPALGVFYTQLAESGKQGPWQQIFVKGTRYRQF